MVHISDGVLSFPVVAFGWVLSFIIIGVTLWWSEKHGDIAEQIPKLSVITAAFFVASLIHIPLGFTSVHLMLNGIVGVILGILSFPAIFTGVSLQAFLFQHGGVTTIGINTVILGIPALISYGIFKTGVKRLPFRNKIESLFGGISGGFAVIISVVFLVFSFMLTGEELTTPASLIAIGHIPIMIIEGLVAVSIVAFLLKVKPELLPVKGGGKNE
ncbi:cobalt transporter CbiM [Methanohalobium sp.]|uniref:cobalt transporter CbiM n=1 Tax=Methanohalobium sp. TaxID=2837493 RepID=UPI0025E7FA34|nr:cobalt transporter CbiM [Methanohalobium sp.]